MSMRKVPAEAAVLLFFLGIVFIFLGILVLAFGLMPSGEVQGGGLIIIGPFPIIFHGEISPLLAILIMLLPIILFVIFILHFLHKAAEHEY